MGAEQHGDVALAAEAAHQLDDRLLMAGVEADQRLVEQQQLRLADQRLRQQQPLALAARHVGERTRGEFAVRRPPSSVCSIVTALGRAQQRQAPALAVHRAGDEVEASDAQIGQHRAGLRHVADCRIAPPRRLGRTRGWRPALGRTSPSRARISVVLPAPLGPSTPMNSPRSMARLTSDSTARPPRRMVARSSSMTLIRRVQGCNGHGADSSPLRGEGARRVRCAGGGSNDAWKGPLPYSNLALRYSITFPAISSRALSRAERGFR